MASAELKRAIQGAEHGRDVHMESFMKLTKVIARKRLLGRKVKKENRARARSSRRIGLFEAQLAELAAATEVVGAPTVEEIAELRELLDTVRDQTVADAMTRAGFNALDRNMNRAMKLGRKGKPKKNDG